VDRSDTEPLWPINAVYLLHGKGGSPDGTVKKLQTLLEQHWPGLDFIRPELPHHDPKSHAEDSVQDILQLQIPQNSLLVGISLGGLVAARLQEVGREDLQVIAIRSPTWEDGVTLETRAERRLAFYSSRDQIIESRIANWPQLASFSRDLEWLNHDTGQHLKYIARLFDWYLEGMLPKWIDDIRRSSSTKEERDEIVWSSMAKVRGRKVWDEHEWFGGRPRDFAEVGKAMRAGRSWGVAWGDWLHEFVGRKDARCLAAEPPSWSSTERRAMMAGTAEFFARVYGLPKPSWVDKPEYFLPEMEYMAYCVSEPDEPEFVVFQPRGKLFQTEDRILAVPGS
jgi:pimeloyl-ACP methyl ester carboxylesterase